MDNGKAHENGKDKLNFTDFGNNPTRKQISKLKEIANQIKDDEMPISSYNAMHKEANLTKKIIIDWINKTADNLSVEN
ncbi:MAG: heme-binding domain-containing protein [Flavobacterium sp.]